MGGLVVAATGLAAAPASAALAGGTQAPSTASGGAEYGALPTSPPVARRFTVAPRSVVSGGRLPAVRVRVEQLGARSVRARVVLWPTRGGKVLRLDLGRIRTGRTVTLRWPRGTVLAPGTYTARLHATGRAGKVLQRTARASGRRSLVVRPAPVPPRAPVTPAPVPSGPDGGIFPVQGPFTYGDGFGADRGDHRHEGVDMSAPAGTPVVAPLAGTITSVDVQEEGAGHYVVETLPDGRALFFAHCRAGSVVARPGAAVAAGARLCDVGSTGRSSGPHLHFEVWEGGWRVRGSRAVDPLPLLRSWER
ncbi:MAG TPA: M23 family metallopeptidase [Baekduia sp.]|nr:M23 family metallopeptidase [Baekduia sp.]